MKQVAIGVVMPDRAPNFDLLRQTAIIGTLRQSKLFGGLAADDIQQVADGCVVKILEKGETLFHEGTLAEGFFIMQTGAVKVFRLTPDGREQVIHVFRPLESFAEIVLATKETYPANAVTLEHTRVILVQKRPFLALLSRKPHLALLMLASMSLHLKHLVTSLQDIKGRQIEGRLAAWLLQQEPEPGGGAAPVIRLGLSKKVLAGQLSVTSETLSRTLARFRDEGVLRVERERLHVLDVAKLRAYAAGEA